MQYLVLVVVALSAIIGGLSIFGGGVEEGAGEGTHAIASLGSDDGGDVDDESTDEAGDERRASVGEIDEQPESERAGGQSRQVVDGPEREEPDDLQEVDSASANQGCTGSVGGVNPLVILLLLAGTGYLGYLVFSDK